MNTHDEVFAQLNVPSENRPVNDTRRGFLGTALGMAAAGAGLAALAATKAEAGPMPGSIPAGDIAILKFLAAAELLECDLWQQYCELAVANSGFHDALSAIDPALVRYICDDRDDECSHADLINGFLASIGETPVNLDPFRTLPSVRAPGAQQIGRLTNLTRLTVDTSWFNRYRGTGNPDFGDGFAQLVNIANRPTIPLSKTTTALQHKTAAYAAAFHFCAIEQGGGSLYTRMVQRVVSPEAKLIVASIGPTEVYHFAAFHKSLENMTGHNSGDGLMFPNLKNNPGVAHAIFPEPCRFFAPNMPLCSVIRPSSLENAGAVAAATGLVNSGLFAGQSRQFLNAAVGLAVAADAA